jgi:cell division protein FtsB
MESDNHGDKAKGERPSGEVIPLSALGAKFAEPPQGAAGAAQESAPVSPRETPREDPLADPLDLLTRSLGAWGRAVHRQARDTDARVDDVAHRLDRADDESARLRAQADAHDHRLAAGERRLGDADAALDEHKARLAAHAVVLDAGAARHAQLETQLATTAIALKAETAALRTDAASLRAELAALAAQNGALAHRIARRRAGVVAALIAVAAWVSWAHVAALLHAGH